MRKLLLDISFFLYMTYNAGEQKINQNLERKH